MPELQVSVVLPYYLRLAEGVYSTAPAAEALHLSAPLILEGVAPRTPVRATFSPNDSDNSVEIEKVRARCAEQLLRRMNHLLRWYRAVSRRADITELTRAQVSPILFEAVGGSVPEAWTLPLAYDTIGTLPSGLAVDPMTQAVRDGLASGSDPSVDDLFLLDAERAAHQGRFREAVLFCWSTIDSVFNRRDGAPVDAGLAGEWSECRDFFKGTGFQVAEEDERGDASFRGPLALSGT